MPVLRLLVCACWLASCLAAVPSKRTEVVLGETGDDRYVAAASGPGGAVYLAGRTAALPPATAGGRRTTIGDRDDAWTYGHAVVEARDPDGALLDRRVFAPGAFLATGIGANDAGVYVAGYAGPGMVAVVAAVGGSLVEPSWAQREITTWCPPEHHSEPRRRDATDQRGVPLVLRLSSDLARVEAATFLEGWQSTWHVPRPLGEDWIQPVHVGLLADGDVVVSHDGGYNLLPAAGEAPSFEHFYAVPDHLSRLSPGLDERRWLESFHTPATDAAKVVRHLHASRHFTMMHGTPRVAWPHPFLGNPRVLRMRVDGRDRILLAGWSPTRTSGEPWWSPFLFRYTAAGERDATLYCPDPMSGGDDRMGGLVSDAAVRTVAVGAEDEILASVIGDGGNSVARRDPRDYRVTVKERWRGSCGPFSGRHLFWGGVVRLHPDDGRLLAGRYLGRARTVRRRGRERLLQQEMWAVDLAAAPGGRVVVAGRFKDGVEASPGAWHDAEAGGFLQVYDRAGLDPVFVTPIDLRPYQILVVGELAWVLGARRVDRERGEDAVAMVVALGEVPDPDADR